ncbi:MAG: TFIIB-type zinc ribbon-containing protein [Methanobrevibacter sp.]|uniref:TFIIB-type zinc ribbon-containing protein n=1 Tax=Methanobrevibacter sp. TaxID=66852 RepID=UPI0025DD739A|nr:TFIIB-type zinc ribbon-containing protein [Methanobrevibacter sp.]MBE6508238.1 TFIIB-type zinc ribbon-containing protein [Methanobrevibacter sp.]
MKVDPLKNMKHANTMCWYCKSTSTRFDEQRGEIFCEKCGTIIHRVNDVLMII